MSQPTKADFQRLNDIVVETDKSLDVAWNEIQGLDIHCTKLEQTIEKLRDQCSELGSQVRVLDAGFADFKKRWEESDHRRWTIYGVMLAAALTFIANLTLLLLRK